MKTNTLTLVPVAVITVLLGLGLMAAQAPAIAEEASAQNDPMKFANGAKTWADNCARCHNRSSETFYITIKKENGKTPQDLPVLISNRCGPDSITICPPYPEHAAKFYTKRRLIQPMKLAEMEPFSYLLYPINRLLSH